MLNINQFPLFHGLSASTLCEIEKNMLIKSFKAQQLILGEDLLSQDLFFILVGKVQAKKFATNGQEIIFVELGEGEIFGEFAAIDGLARSTQVIALSNMVMGRLSPKYFRALLLQEPQLGLNLATHLVQKLRLLTERVYDYAAFSVSMRIRKKLLELATKQDEKTGAIRLHPAPTQYEIAVMTGTHREAVSREFTLLTKLGILETGRRLIILRDKKRLEQMLLAAAS